MSVQPLTSDERIALLRLARVSIERSLGLDTIEPELPARLEREQRGAFVTLRSDGDLRGCIGYVEPIETIADAVRQLAVKSASEDPRFDNVIVRELDSITIEVSVLSPLSPCEDLRGLQVGRHGVVVEKDSSRGLLLPEVAVEAEWDAEEFVSHCCVKAGLPRGAWKTGGVRVFTFETDHFGETEQTGAANARG